MCVCVVGFFEVSVIDIEYLPVKMCLLFLQDVKRLLLNLFGMSMPKKVDNGEKSSIWKETSESPNLNANYCLWLGTDLNKLEVKGGFITLQIYC